MKSENAALAVIGIAEVFQIMAANLPSPTTMRTGGSDPRRMAQLKRGLVIGGVTAVALTAGVSYFTYEDDPDAAIFLFVGALLALGVFVYESKRALDLAKSEGGIGSGY